MTKDGKSIVFEIVQFKNDRDIHAQAECHTGSIYLFDAESGLLKQRIQEKPNGEMCLFDDCPDMTYYLYPLSTDETIKINANHIQPDSALMKMISSDLDSSYSHGWISDNNVLSKYKNYMVAANQALRRDDKSEAVLY
jgi:hypothetical protein